MPEPTEPTPSAPAIPGFAVPAAGAAQLTERLLDSRIVVVGGQIDDALAHTVCSQLLVLDAAAPGGISGRPAYPGDTPDPRATARVS